MELSKFYPLQAELDQFVMDKHNLEIDESIIDKRIFAFKVELGELANIVPIFKYWKVSQEPTESRERILDEFVDCMHFLLSIGNAREYTRFVPSVPMMESEPDSIEKFYIFNRLMINPIGSTGQYQHAWANLLWLGHVLGFTEQDIEEGYMKKHKVNYDRQRGGY